MSNRLEKFGPAEERELFIRENSVALVNNLEKRILRLQGQIEFLEKSRKSLREQLRKLTPKPAPFELNHPA